jgi:hypothetical protein
MVCIAGVARPEDQCTKKQEFSENENVSSRNIMRAQKLKKRILKKERKNGSRAKNKHE